MTKQQAEQTTWRLWECDRGNRWSSVIRFADPSMNCLVTHLQPTKVCEFSGCTHDHGIKAVRDTTDRTEAHDWFKSVA